MACSLAEAGCCVSQGCVQLTRSNKISEVCTTWEASLNPTVLCVTGRNTSTFSFPSKALLLSFGLFSGVFLIEYLFVSKVCLYLGHMGSVQQVRREVDVVDWVTLR